MLGSLKLAAINVARRRAFVRRLQHVVALPHGTTGVAADDLHQERPDEHL